jgi:hypothetical protein
VSSALIAKASAVVCRQKQPQPAEETAEETAEERKTVEEKGR